jgi:protein-ribulosamine 3-kinase
MQARTLRTMRWNWATEFSSISRDKIYTEHYLRHSPAAELSNKFDDHNRLYSLKGAINYAAGHPGSALPKR